MRHIIVHNIHDHLCKHVSPSLGNARFPLSSQNVLYPLPAGVARAFPKVQEVFVIVRQGLRASAPAQGISSLDPFRDGSGWNGLLRARAAGGCGAQMKSKAKQVALLSLCFSMKPDRRDYLFSSSQLITGLASATHCARVSSYRSALAFASTDASTVARTSSSATGPSGTSATYLMM